MAEAFLADSSARSEARFAVIVTFDIRAGACNRFLQLVRDNAAASLAHERGCLAFDVLRPASNPNDSVVLYEAYLDREAFDRHLATAHFAAFDAASQALVHDKRVRAYSIEPPGEQ